MVVAGNDVGVGGQVPDQVVAFHFLPGTVGIAQVGLNELDVLPAQMRFDEFAAAVRQVVEDGDVDACGGQQVHDMAADEAGAAGQKYARCAGQVHFVFFLSSLIRLWAAAVTASREPSLLAQPVARIREVSRL